MKRLLILSLISLNTLLYPAAPLFHAVVAEMWCESCEKFTEEEKKEFFIGTLFPSKDSGKLSREVMERCGLTVEKIKTIESPFMKGMQLHAFVDAIRSRYVSKEQMHDVTNLIKQEFDGSDIYLQMIEDEILYDMREEGASSYIADFFTTILEKEFTFRIPGDFIEKWHQHHIGYFRSRPSDYFQKILTSEENIIKERNQKIHQAILRFRDHDKIHCYLLALLMKFNTLFTENAIKNANISE